MGVWFRVFFIGFLAFGLTGCVLESKKPVFADGDAKLLLAGYPNLAAYERGDDGWKKNTDPFSFTAEASHYLVKADTSDMQVFFVPIDGPWWVLQATETAGSTSYVLVKAEAKELLLYPLDCKTLEESGTFMGQIDFVESDCFIAADADKTALFKSLIPASSEASSKLVSEP